MIRTNHQQCKAEQKHWITEHVLGICISIPRQWVAHEWFDCDWLCTDSVIVRLFSYNVMFPMLLVTCTLISGLAAKECFLVSTSHLAPHIPCVYHVTMGRTAGLTSAERISSLQKRTIQEQVLQGKKEATAILKKKSHLWITVASNLNGLGYTSDGLR